MSMKQVQEGINYLRLLNDPNNSIISLADDLMVSEKHIKECIAAARAHKDAANRPPKVVMVQPNVKVHKNLTTGELQAVEEVEVELLRDIIVRFGHEERSEFQTMLPVTVRITRKRI